MKPPDIISKNNKIQKGHSSFFIAANDFSINEFLILKDSLVYFDGKRNVAVNMGEFGIFQKNNIPDLIKDALPEDGKRNYIVEKNSNCDFEIDCLPIGWRGIWHINHFDKWSGSFSDYLERIKEMHDRHIITNSFWITCGYGFKFKYNSNTEWIFRPIGSYFNEKEERLRFIIDRIHNRKIEQIISKRLLDGVALPSVEPQ